MKKFISIYLLIALSLIQINELNSQSLFEFYSISNISLTNDELGRISVLQQDMCTKVLQIVKTGNPFDYQVEGIISFQIPGFEGSITAEFNELTQGNLEFSWAGNLINHRGHFSIIEKNGFRGGIIQIDGRFFEIMPINSDYETFQRN